MNRPRHIRLLAAALPVLVLAGAVGLWSGAESLEGCAEARRPALTYPDYSGTVIPPNIAPLNLKILEPGKKFCLRVSGRSGAPLAIFSAGGKIQIRAAAWKTLLQANRGGELRTDIYAKGANGWTHFETARNRVAGEAIDPYVVYRYIPPVYDKWDQISLRQRSLESFEERVLFDNQRSTAPDGKTAGSVCVNCHTFLNHGTRQMLIHMRPAQKGQIPAMVLVRDGQARKIDTRSGANGPATYSSWRPGGKLLAFSRNSIVQMFHSAGVETREVIDRDSDLALYDVETGKTFTVPQISRPDWLETFPAWSPDGKFLYFCSARLLWTDKKNGALKEYDRIQYDLARIAYDAATGQWGQVETVVAAAQLGKSISLPQISPDGRYLMFTAHAYGAFPIFQPSADLFLLDLSRNAPPRRLDEINSDRTDSYHTWSSNGRWVIFASKREDGIFARLFMAHLEESGRFGKPFVMPQQDPDFYGRCLMTYNRPELIQEPVAVTASELTRAINAPSGSDTPPAGAAAPGDAPWQPLK
jgi:hypothetical protein